NVPGVAAVQTLSNGSYDFSNIAAGTYQIQVLPPSNATVGILTPGSAGGTAGSDEIQMTLGASQNATDYNFAILGAVPNQTALATTAAPVDAAAPSGYTIVANQSQVNVANASDTGFTFTGAEVGTTYNYTVSSSGGGTAVTGSGSVTSATQDVSGINVSTLLDGTLTYSVTLTDTSGDIGTAATATATLDTVVPAGYTITADQPVINTATLADCGFTLNNATTDTTYDYTITSTGGGTAVTGSGSVTSAT